MSSKLPFILGGVLVAGVAAAFLLNGAAPRADPPKEVFESESEAYIAAVFYARDTGAQITRTTGTPSMEPFITGSVYATVARAEFASLQPGEIAVYRAAWHPASPVMHRLVLKDAGGWIASGDNNSRSEAFERVTSTNLVGKVTKVFAWAK